MANREKATSNILLGALAAVCLSNGVNSPQVLDKLGSFLQTVAAVVVLSRRSSGVSKDDYAGAVADLATDTWEGFSEFLPVKEGALKVLKLAHVPDAFVPAVEAQLEALRGTDWFAQWQQRSRLVLGGSGSGKTTFMLWEVYQALAAGSYDLTICDMDYGSAHEGGSANTWLGLPRDRFIRWKLSDIYQAVTDMGRLVDARASAQAEGKPTDLSWKTLVLDEFPSVRRQVEADMGKEALATFDNALRTLLARGLKQRVRFIAGSQNPNVADTGIKITDLNQTNILFLGGFACDSGVLQVYGCKGDGADLATKAKALKGHRVAVAKLDSGSRVVVVPTFDPSSVALQLPPELTQTEGDRWLSENLEAITAMASEGQSKTAIAKALGVNNRKASDPRYAALSTFINQAQEG
jgi:hypothetical protein